MPECLYPGKAPNLPRIITKGLTMTNPIPNLPSDFDYTDNFAQARREQARAVHSMFSALLARVGKLVTR